MRWASDATVFDVSNVSDYFWGSRQEEWRIGQHFPCLKLPFPVMWMEWRRPREIITQGGHAVDPRKAPVRTAVLLRQWDTPPDAKVYPAEKASQVDENASEWIDIILFFQNEDSTVVGPIFFAAFAIDERGSYIEDSWSGLCVPLSERDVSAMLEPQQAAHFRSLATEISPHCYPALLGLSFLHCKNVTRIVHRPEAWHVRGFRKRHGRSPVSYYTLNIEPMKEVLRREGHSETVGIAKALHICRGHFANYDEKPLFGKYTGTFWKPAHVRGSLKHGAVVKDYAVKAPSTT